MTRPTTRDAIYRGRVFDVKVIEPCVRWGAFVGASESECTSHSFPLQ